MSLRTEAVGAAAVKAAVSTRMVGVGAMAVKAAVSPRVLEQRLLVAASLREAGV